MVTDDAGHPLRIVGVNLDIADLREAGETVRRTTAPLHAIGACSPDLIYATDAEGRYLSCGVTQERGRGDRHNPGQAAALMANDRRIIETGLS